MSFLKSLFAGVKDKEAYIQALTRAISDARIEETEAAELRRIAAQLKLSTEEVQAANRAAIERHALSAVSDAELSGLEADLLKRQCEVLQVRWESIDPKVLAHVGRVVALQRILAGQLPVVPTSALPILLEPGETVHFAAECGVFEDRVVARSSGGGFGGVRFRIARGVSVGLGGYRGRSVPITARVCVAQGWLLFTSSHARFFGTKKGFQKSCSKVAGAEAFQDGVALYFTDRQSAALLTYLGDVDPAVPEAILVHLLQA